MRAGIFLASWPWFPPSEQVGEIGDGWLPFMLDPEHAGTLFEPLDRGLERAGRPRSEIDVAACTAVAGDRDRAAAALTPELIDSMALATTPGALDDRLAAFAGIGVDALVGVPCGADRALVVRTLAEATR